MDEQRPKRRLFSGMTRNKRYVLKASAAALLFWLLQFIYQSYFFSFNGGYSILRASSFSAATLISIALIIGPLAVLTRYNFIFHRRTVAVWGFTFAIVHMLSALNLVYGFNIQLVFASLNPFANPVIFGVLAFLIFLPLYATSTDWALDRVGYKNWKTLHRLVYFGYIFLVLHILLVNPPALKSVPGYVLMAVTTLALVLQIAGFARTVARTRSKKAAITGVLIIIFGALLLFLAITRVQL